MLQIWRAIMNKRNAVGNKTRKFKAAVSPTTYRCCHMGTFQNDGWTQTQKSDGQDTVKNTATSPDPDKLAAEIQGFHKAASHYQFKIHLKQIIVTLVHLRPPWQIKTAAMIGGETAVLMSSWCYSFGYPLSFEQGFFLFSRERVLPVSNDLSVEPAVTLLIMK